MPRLAVMMVLLAAVATAADASPRLESLTIPGSPAFVRVARDVIAVQFAIDPSLASGNGLFEEADRVPSYTTRAMASLVKRLDRDLRDLRGMPWRTWTTDEQIDFRWIYANAELARRLLTVERIFTRRAGAWLEPLANNLIALVTYAPDRLDLQASILGRVPGMLAEMRTVLTSPTQRDVAAAKGLIDGLLEMCRSPLDQTRPAAARLAAARQAAAAALIRYRDELGSLQGLPESQMIGAENYAWRYRHAMLLPWTPQQLLAVAEDELKKLDARLAGMAPVSKPVPTDGQREEARTLTQDKLLALYDGIEVANREAIVRSGFATIPPEVGPIHARVTPDAMVPLTGDGGSMNPPPAMGDFNVGYWNVEHLRDDWTPDRRLDAVLYAEDFRTTWMGPYAAHEGMPGHHLQLSLARLNPDPIRSLLADSVQNEGWALYAEEAFWKAGGLGPSPDAEHNVLESYRHRIRRVVYDVNIETGVWTLQQGADYKHQANPGQGKIDEDLQRTLNWPTQLICYFAGKVQIVQLKADYQAKMGSRYSDRAFHDALLAVGSIPIVFARAKLLGEPVPDI